MTNLAQQRNKTPQRWRQWLRRGLDIIWETIVVGLLVNMIANAIKIEDVLRWIVQNPLISLPLIIGFILLTVLERIVNPLPTPPHPRRVMMWVKQALQYVIMVGLLVIVLSSLLVPLSISTVAITMIPLAVIALILLAIQVFSWIQLQPSQGQLSLPLPPPMNTISRRSFLHILFALVIVSVPTALTYLIARLEELLSLLFPPPIVVTVLYSTEKREWLNDAMGKFNQKWAKRGIRVVLVDERGSLDAVEKILEGKSERPIVWSPASSLELHLLSAKWKQKYPDRQDIITYTGDHAPQSVVHSPLVFAVWQRQATVLSNSPYKVIDWSGIHALLSLRNWSDIGGNSSWGEVKFGQTQPDLSNSGLLTITLMAYSYFNKQSDLGPMDVANPQFKKYFKEIEDQVWCFGPSSGTFMDTVIQRGPNEFSIVTTYENLVLTKEKEAMDHWGEPLVMSYPPSLNIISDHPFAILQGDWMKQQEQSAAQEFLNFLLDDEQQKNALTFGFRSYNEQAQTTAAVPGNRFRGQPSFLQNQIKSEEDLKPLAQTPSGEVINALITLWQAQNYDRQC